MSFEISKGNDGHNIDFPKETPSLSLNSRQDYNPNFFKTSDSDKENLMAQGFPNPIIEGSGSISGRGHAHGTGHFEGSGAASGEGTVTGTGYVVHRDQNGHLEVRHGTGTVSGKGAVFGTGSGDGTVEHSQGSGTVSGTGHVRHHRF